MREYHHLTFTKRLQIEALLKNKVHKQKIADYVGTSLSNLYRELKRGEYKRLNGQTWEYEISYSPDIAEKKYKENLKAKGGVLKIGKNFALAEYIERKILVEKYTPLAVAAELRKEDSPFDITLCRNTIYSYIRNGLFLNLSDADLPIKSKRRKKKPRQTQKRAPRGMSIEQRPKEVSERSTFGHWEMDCVCGSTKAVFLVLTERLTRKEIIMKMPNQKAESVVRCLNKLEDKYGKLFSRIFKTITVDNGVEFSDCAGMEKSKYGEFKRTSVYYCHPYSSWERGTNERINREIRRLVPKGSSLSKYTNKDVQRIENWINSYPRQILGFRSSEDLFNQYLNSTG